MEIYTIGFTKKRAAEFFGALTKAGIEQLVDVRLNNRSQLAGFTKRHDLEYFLREICHANYVHEPLLAPSQPLLDAYKKRGGPWSVFEKEFLELLRKRRIETSIEKTLFAPRTVLLCSEPTPEQCHRRLVLEYLNSTWGNIRPVHL